MHSHWLAYLPLGILGLVRWTSWLIRRLPASLYRPAVNDFRLPLSVVVPVYQEDPVIFARAIESWMANGVDEIILVIDATDRACIEVASRYPVRVEITDVPGKRDALRRGWELASTPLVALVDSDVIWADDVAAKVSMPFADERVGGVATRQNVYESHGFLQRINDMYLDYRYFDENAAQSAFGGAVSCISGRTAVYRRSLLLDVSDEFMREMFLGVHCLSGDDKCLTRLILQRGHRALLQRSARVWSTFPSTPRIFFKQRLRWARNTWRSDLRSLCMASTWRHRPFLAFTMVDKAVSSFTLLAAPVFMTVAIVNQHWVFVASLALWWWVSRAAKMLPHLRRRPSSLLLIPPFVLLSFAMAIVKIWALLTIRQQRWLTRQVLVRNGEVVRDTSPDGSAELVDAASAARGTAEVRRHPLGSGLSRWLPRGRWMWFGGASALLALFWLSVSATPGEASPVRGSNTPPTAIVLRPARVDFLSDGVVVRSYHHAPRAIGLLELARVAGPQWIRARGPGTLELRTPLVQAPGSALLVGEPHVRRVLIHRGAYLRGSQATASLQGVKVEGWNQRWDAPSANHDRRGFVYYSRDSSVSVVASTFSSLGGAGTEIGALTLTSGSSGRIVDSRFLHSGGVRLIATGAVRVEELDVSESSGDGLVVRQSPKVALSSLRASSNQGNGIVLSGPGRAPSVRGRIDVSRNRGAGLLAKDVSRTALPSVNTDRNGRAGVILDRAPAVLDRLRADREHVGLSVASGTRGVRLHDATVTSSSVGLGLDGTDIDVAGGRISDTSTGVRVGGFGTRIALKKIRLRDTVTGVDMDDRARSVSFQGLTLDRTRQVGLQIRGSQVQVADTTIRAATTGIALLGGASAVSLMRGTIEDADVGVSMDSSTRSVSVEGLTIERSRSAGVRTSGSRTAITSTTVSGGTTGYDLRGGARTMSVTGGSVTATTGAGVSATSSVSDLKLTDLEVRPQAGTGIASGAQDLVVEGGSVHGAALGLDLRGSSRLRGISVSAEGDAARVSSDAWASFTRVELIGGDEGLWAGERARVWLQGSRVDARVATRGPVQLVGANDLPPLPVPWLGIVGLLVVFAAAAFEIVRRLRETSSDRDVLAPAHVRNHF